MVILLFKSHILVIILIRIICNIHYYLKNYYKDDNKNMLYFKEI